MLDQTLQYERETYTLGAVVLLVSGVRLTGHRGRSCENCTYLERPEWRLPARSLGSIAVARWRSLAGCTGSGGRTGVKSRGPPIGSEMKLFRRKIWYCILQRNLYSGSDFTRKLRAQAPGFTGSGRLGFRSLVPTGCPYGEFTLADAMGWRGLKPGSNLHVHSIQWEWERLGRYQGVRGDVRFVRSDPTLGR